MAEAQLRWVLPAGLVARLDWSTLRQGPTDSANVTGRALRSDVVFDLQTTSGERLFVHVLFEHQRTSDPLMALRMVEYATRIWRYVIESADGPLRTLPAIVPVVLYNGTTRWRAALGIEQLAPAPEPWGLDDLQLRGRYLLCDLSEVDDEELSVGAVHVHLKLGLLVLKHSSAVDFWRRFAAWSEVLLDVFRMEGGRDRVDAVLNYLYGAASPPSEDDVRRVIELLPDFEGDMQTWAESIREEARREGLEKGLEQGLEKGLEKGLEAGLENGRRELLREILGARFGELPPEVGARLDDATHTQITRWSRRVLDPTLSLEQVLDEAS